MTPDQVLEYIQEHDIQFVDLRWTTLDGAWLHQTVDANCLTVGTFAEGIACTATADGPVAERRLQPVAATAAADPFMQHPTLAMICDVRDAAGGAADDDPRGVARRAAQQWQAHGAVTAPRLAARLGFFVFDQVSFDQGLSGGHYRVESREGIWRRGSGDPDNLGQQVPPQAGAGRLPPTDSLHNLRAEMVAALEMFGVPAVGHWRGAGSASQAVVDLGHGPLLEMADRLTVARYVIRNVAARHGKVATFMPCPLASDARSNLELGLAVPAAQGGLLEPMVAGLAEHAGSLDALLNPLTNGYRRAGVPGRITAAPAATGGDDGWLWLWPAAPCCNPYLALSGVALAARDGLQTGRSLADAGVEAASAGGATSWLVMSPTLFEAALAALEADRGYLAADGVVADAVLACWVDCRRAEAERVAQLPHPQEFCQHFDA